jgi:hypothetical protein
VIDVEEGQTFAALQAVCPGVEPAPKQDDLLDALRDGCACAIVDESRARDGRGAGSGPPVVDDAAHHVDQPWKRRQRDEPAQTGAQEGLREGVREEPCLRRPRVLEGTEQRHVLGRAAGSAWLHASSRRRDVRPWVTGA